MSTDFNPTDNKRIIRREWNAPLLLFLYQQFNKKLAYFGLPSPLAEDIHDWIDFIDYVIAFQCRKYPFPSDPSQDDTHIRELELRLNNLMRQKRINDFQLYDGYIEEVLINGKDNDNLIFDLRDFITLYNLDFCNEITFPQKVLNETTGKEELIYKLHVIKKILDIQSHNNSLPYKFVFFLTVKATFWETEASDYLERVKDDPIYGIYLSGLEDLIGIEKSVRILRAYIFQTITHLLCANSYIPEFLPVVKYRGSGPHTLVQFTIVCTFEPTFGRAAISLQNPLDFLKQGFLEPDTAINHLSPIAFDSIGEITPSSDSVTLFTNSKVYEQFWQ